MSNNAGTFVDNTENEEINNNNLVQISDKNTLIWIKLKLGLQELPAMVDSGANPNCISHRCFQASRYLKNLPRFKYTGNIIVDANGQAVEPEFVVKVH